MRAGIPSHPALSQLRRASAPDITVPERRREEPLSGTSPSRPSPLHPPSSSRPLSAPRRSLDELSLRRIAEQRPGYKHPGQSSHNSKMTATLGYGASDFFGGFQSPRFNAFNSSSEDPLPSASNQTRRTNVIPQTRELYLHPSQIFTPNANNSHDGASGYFGSPQGSGNDHQNGSGLETTIALPPMLTLEEIIQPHVFAKQEPADPSLPASATFGAPAIAGQASTALHNGSNSYLGASSYGAYPAYTVSFPFTSSPFPGHGL